MSTSIYDFTDYRTYLRKALTERGAKLSLASFLSCQSAYVSRVLSDQADLSLEQTLKASEFFKLNSHETDYFVLLVSQAKAGSTALQNYYKAKTILAQKHAKNLKTKFSYATELTPVEKATFYSSWEYSAIFLMTMIPNSNERKQIQKHLNLTSENFLKKLSFLMETGLVEAKGEYLTTGKKRIHLEKGSDFERTIQTSWRLKAIESFPKQTENEARYSAAYVLSNEDAEKVRLMLLNCVTSVEEIATKSPEETLFGLCVDWFKV